MRIPNTSPHLIVVALLCAGLSLHAQTQGNAPSVVDSYESAAQMNGGTGACGSSAGCTNFPEGANQDDFIWCGAAQERIDGPTLGCNGGSPGAVGVNPPWTMIDSLGTNLNMQASAFVSTGGTPDGYVQSGYACVASTTATYRVTWTGWGSFCSTSFSCIRVPHLCSSGSVTMDGAIQSASSATGSLSTASTSNTTTLLNDFLIEYGTISHSGSGHVSANGNSPFGLAVNDPTRGMGVYWAIAPTLGSNTATMTNLDATNNLVMQSLAFKVPPVLGDSDMPQGAAGTAYSAQLHCYGVASSTPTYTLVSGSVGPGLTLNANGSVTGTPTTPGNYPFTATCTDGSITSSVRSLSIDIGASFKSITIDATTSSGDFNIQPKSFTLPATCGDAIDIHASAADDTHTGQGYIQTINGAAGYVKDDLGDPVHQYLFNGGTYRGPDVEWVICPVGATGTRTVTVANGTGSSSGLNYRAELLHGVQCGLDINNTKTTVVQSPTTTISVPVTTLASNELARVQVSTLNNNSTTVALSSPFTTDYTSTTFGVYTVGHAFISSPASTTVTATFTSPASSDIWSITGSAFRPRIPSSACGESLTSAVHHRTQIY